MEWQNISNEWLLGRFRIPEGKLRVVIDSDTYNEVDDQFAVAYALLSPERLDVEAIYAAPFRNERAADAAEGMRKSYDEILRLLGHMGRESENFVFRGADSFLPDEDTPVDSEAVRDLIQRAMAADEADPLYVLALGAITNVASALLIEPAIREKIVVVWLGGQPLTRNTAREFNLAEDVPAARVIFNSGVPAVLLPVHGVTGTMITSPAEIRCWLEGKNALCDMLVDRFCSYRADAHLPGWSKVLYDIAVVGYMLHPDKWAAAELAHSPLLTDDCRWVHDTRRHFINEVVALNRKAIFMDMFPKLASL